MDKIIRKILVFLHAIFDFSSQCSADLTGRQQQ
jgi:hypothetical protein